MIHRKHEIKVRMDDEEFEALNDCVRASGCSREQYLRTIAKGMRPVAVPPLDYFNLIREIRRVGYNMRQIAVKAHSLGLVDAPEYRKNANQILWQCDDLMMICLPRKEKPNGGDRNLGGA